MIKMKWRRLIKWEKIYYQNVLIKSSTRASLRWKYKVDYDSRSSSQFRSSWFPSMRSFALHIVSMAVIGWWRAKWDYPSTDGMTSEHGSSDDVTCWEDDDDVSRREGFFAKSHKPVQPNLCWSKNTQAPLYGPMLPWPHDLPVTISHSYWSDLTIHQI